LDALVVAEEQPEKKKKKKKNKDAVPRTDYVVEEEAMAIDPPCELITFTSMAWVTERLFNSFNRGQEEKEEETRC